MSEFNTIDVVALLPRVRCPTLVLHSRDDVRVPFEEGRLLAMNIPGATLIPIDSRNHLLLEDGPAGARRARRSSSSCRLPAPCPRPAPWPRSLRAGARCWN